MNLIDSTIVAAVIKTEEEIYIMKTVEEMIGDMAEVTADGTGAEVCHKGEEIGLVTRGTMSMGVIGTGISEAHLSRGETPQSTSKAKGIEIGTSMMIDGLMTHPIIVCTRRRNA